VVLKVKNGEVGVSDKAIRKPIERTGFLLVVVPLLCPSFCSSSNSRSETIQVNLLCMHYNATTNERTVVGGDEFGIQAAFDDAVAELEEGVRRGRCGSVGADVAVGAAAMQPSPNRPAPPGQVLVAVVLFVQARRGSDLHGRFGEEVVVVVQLIFDVVRKEFRAHEQARYGPNRDRYRRYRRRRRRR